MEDLPNVADRFREMQTKGKNFKNPGIDGPSVNSNLTLTYCYFNFQSLADVSLPATSPLLQSFAHGGAEAMWRRCCEAARECCAKIGVASASVENGSIVPLTGE